MSRHSIPTARYQTFTDAEAAVAFVKSAPFAARVIKASGLAAGKGVVVATSEAEAVTAVNDIFGGAFGAAGNTVVVEELLHGPEVSFLAFCDGERAAPMPPAQDHKRLADGDEGPNTGGMGAYAPCPLLPAAAQEHVMRTIVQVRREGVSF
jgi:phosphoribosylamine--glycine ligase/phosphoribosylglycinamide formyltransferase/phosphoribosylformylglycinamidine cyclo-ligase